MKKAMLLSANDNIATLLEDAFEKEIVKIWDWNKDLVGSIVCISKISTGHKISIKNIAVGEPIFKYGHVIGKALSAIKMGEWVHVHNLESMRGRGDLV